MKCHILCDVQYKRCFSHRWTRCDQYQVGRLQTGSPVVQIDKSGWNTCYRSGSLCCIFNLLQRIHNYLTDRNIVPAATSCGEQIKYFLLRHIHDRINTFLTGITLILNLFIQPDESAPHGIVFYNFCVILNICRSRNRIQKFFHIGKT